MAILKNLRV